MHRGGKTTTGLYPLCSRLLLTDCFSPVADCISIGAERKWNVSIKEEILLLRIRNLIEQNNSLTVA